MLYKLFLARHCTLKNLIPGNSYVTCNSIDQIESTILHVCLDETDLETVATSGAGMKTELDSSLLSRSLLTGNGQR